MRRKRVTSTKQPEEAKGFNNGQLVAIGWRYLLLVILLFKIVRYKISETEWMARNDRCHEPMQ